MTARPRKVSDDDVFSAAQRVMQRVAPGSCGLLRLVNLAQAQAAGAAGLASYAATLSARCPVVLAGEPVPKIREGIVCLNEPARAQVCLAVFRAGRTLNELLAPLV